MLKNSTSSTVSNDEIKKFESMAEDWWNVSGKFKPLHDLTPTRLKYITDLTKSHFNITNLKGIDILDIGCGGGIISEPLSNIGGNVTGIDASLININIAQNHAKLSNLIINYQNITAEELVKTQAEFQLILALEIIEHIENIEFFIESCAKLLKTGGLLIFSTINKTTESFFKTIIAAEYILRWLPIGTHSWSKFIKPSQISDYACKNGLRMISLKGISYSLFSKDWGITDDINSNYFIAFTK